MMAYEQYDVMPDVVTLAKALGCGVPVGAFAARGEAANALVPGDHGSTYGGNPLAAAAVNIVFELFKSEKVLENVSRVSNYLTRAFDNLVQKYDCIKERRGLGLMQGLKFDQSVGKIIQTAMEKGLITFSAGSDIIRFVPPLIIKEQHIDEMLDILEESIRENI